MTTANRQSAREIELQRVARLVRVLDHLFQLRKSPQAGGNRRTGVGLDALAGFLFPVVGDALTGAVGLIVMLVAVRRRVPTVVLARMLLNLAVDLVVGMLPIVGDVFDLLWRSNVRNLELLERHASEGARATIRDYAIVCMAVVLVLTCALSPVVLVLSYT